MCLVKDLESGWSGLGSSWVGSDLGAPVYIWLLLAANPDCLVLDVLDLVLDVLGLDVVSGGLGRRCWRAGNSGLGLVRS